MEGLSTLEFHRDGIGLVPPDADSDRSVAVFVRRSGGAGRPVRLCSCSSGSPRRKSCSHLRALDSRVDDCHLVWGGLRWDQVFETTRWNRLARLLYAGEPLAADAARLVGSPTDDAPAYVVAGADGTALLRARAGPAGARLVDRLGVAAGSDTRARVLRKLRLLQATPAEQAINDAGLKTERQSFEESFWALVGYHALREQGDATGSFHAAIEPHTGQFTLGYRTDDGPDILRLTVPRSRVEAALAFLEQETDTPAPEPIPLRSLFKVSSETILDLPVRPALLDLQSRGEARLLAQDGIEKFRYGRLLYLEGLQLLTEVERAGVTRKFAAPIDMRLAKSVVPTLDGDAGLAPPALSPTDPPTGPVTYKDYDAIDVAPVALDAGGFWLAVRYRFGPTSLSLAEIRRAREEKLPFLEVPGGWVDLGAPALRDLEQIQADVRDINGDDDQVRLRPRDLLRLKTATTRPVTVRGDHDLSDVLDRLLNLQPSAPRVAPAGLRTPLRAYQKVGLDWLVFLFENGLSGLLCDDMGLGKTHQAMALLAAAAEQCGAQGPFLIVCPTTVVSHWRQKLRDHAPDLKVVPYQGPERRLPTTLPPRAILLTSYGILRNDADKLSGFLFDVAVFDEIQQVKNRETQSHRAAALLRARMKLGLTGTPIENDLQELKVLFDLVLPGYLGGDRSFQERFSSPPSSASGQGLPALRRLVSPFLLRRLKTSVLEELPDKIEDVRTCVLSANQVELYRDALAAKAGPLVDSLRRGGSAVPYIHIFALLNVLKQVCNHPALALKRPADYLEMSSGKWDLFEEILSESLESGQKIVVFTQFLGMIDIMERHLRERGVEFATLTGSSSNRGELVERFNTEPSCRVFLGSLKAGGTGIDLVGGSVVIHYDRWWNAAREDQATDRVHRMGQKRAVQVFKLVTEGTLEERISTIIERKRQLVADTLHADDPHLAKIFTREELIEILS